MRALSLLALLPLLATDLHAQCQDTLIGDEPIVTEVTNKDGSALTLKVTRCETELSLKSVDTAKVLLSLQGGSGHSAFLDLNDDGLYEIDMVSGCGVANCSHTIYTFEPKTLTLRKLLAFSGTDLRKVEGYFFSVSRQGASEYWADGYKILDLARLEIEPTPSFRVCNCHDKRTDQQVCHIPLPAQERKSAFAKQVVKAFCFPETIVRYGWRN